ncbi:MAG: hypothetical protein AB7F98_12555 [Novosphingobium sp.]
MMRSIFAGYLAAAALGSIALPAMAATPAVTATLANPSVRLWYEGTGRLSDNIAPPREFPLWNTIIGAGAAEENANDALFTVEVRTRGQQNVSQPLALTATDARGKVLASRTLRGVLTSEAGRMTAALWVRDIGCAGAVTFVAQMGTRRQTVRLDFDCGE